MVFIRLPTGLRVLRYSDKPHDTLWEPDLFDILHNTKAVFAAACLFKRTGASRIISRRAGGLT